MRHAVYGLPPADLVETPGDAVQLSPLIPGAARLEDVAEGSLDGLAILAPAGTVERRYALALGLRALRPGGALTALAPKERGGARLAKELRGLGCAVVEEARRHHRLCRAARPGTPGGLDPAIQAAITEGAPRHVDNLGLCTQPGIFSWNRLDPGSGLLLAHLPRLSGRGADFGCGLGLLALGVLRAGEAGATGVAALDLIDLDRRAVEMARRNVADPRATVHWADLRRPDADLAARLTRLDFVVMNPPFHDGGAEDRTLGQALIARAAESLRPGGRLLVTANAHLPYEAPLRAAFREVSPLAAAGGYKVYEARR